MTVHVVRPAYESEQDREHERALADRLAFACDAVAVKLPQRYELDYAMLRNGDIAAFAELKRRSHPLGHYPTYMLALSKWRAGLDLARITAARCLLVVEFTDGDAWTRIQPCHLRVTVGGRKDRGDWQDTEPVVHIPINRFYPLKASQP